LVDDALTAGREEDIIKFAPGEYRMQLPTSDTDGSSSVFQFVGSGRDETKVTLLKNRNKDGESGMWLSAYGLFFDMQVEGNLADDYTNFSPNLFHCRTSTQWADVMRAHDTTFTAPQDIGGMEANWCMFVQGLRLLFNYNSTIENTTIEGDLTVKRYTTAQNGNQTALIIRLSKEMLLLRVSRSSWREPV